MIVKIGSFPQIGMKITNICNIYIFDDVMFIWGSLVMCIYLRIPSFEVSPLQRATTMASASQQKNARPNMLPKKNEWSEPSRVSTSILLLYNINVYIQYFNKKNTSPFFRKLKGWCKMTTSHQQKRFSRIASTNKTTKWSSVRFKFSKSTQNTLPLTWATK